MKISKYTKRCSVISLLFLLAVYAISKLYLSHGSREHVIAEQYKSKVDIFDNKSFELVVRTTCRAHYIGETKRWLMKSLKLFWLRHEANLVIVLDKEKDKYDKKCIEELSETWPYPAIRYRDAATDTRPPIVWRGGRYRMYWDYFYPDKYTSSEYIGFLDTDSMFVTPLIPQVLFTNGSKPVVNARIGLGHGGYPCWSDTSEYMIGQKEVVQCMTYFPVVYKVEHVVEARLFIGQRFNKTFDEVYKYVIEEKEPKRDCMCQYSIICNYLWYYHRDEYDWHLLTHPNTGIWNGEMRQNSQETPEYFKSLNPIYKIPKPRVAIHIRHYKDNGKWIDGNPLREPAITNLTLRLHQGLCFTYGFKKCPDKCKSIDRNSLQNTLFTFEDAEWFFDKTCIDEQKKHYRMVEEYFEKNDINYNCKLFDTLRD